MFRMVLAALDLKEHLMKIVTEHKYSPITTEKRHFLAREVPAYDEVHSREGGSDSSGTTSHRRAH